MLERHHVFLAGGQIMKPKQSEVGLSADLHTFVSRRSSGCGSSLATTHTNILCSWKHVSAVPCVAQDGRGTSTHPLLKGLDVFFLKN